MSVAAAASTDIRFIRITNDPPRVSTRSSNTPTLDGRQRGQGPSFVLCKSVNLKRIYESNLWPQHFLFACVCARRFVIQRKNLGENLRGMIALGHGVESACRYARRANHLIVAIAHTLENMRWIAPRTS